MNLREALFFNRLPLWGMSKLRTPCSSRTSSRRSPPKATAWPRRPATRLPAQSWAACRGSFALIDCEWQAPVVAGVVAFCVKLGDPVSYVHFQVCLTLAPSEDSPDRGQELCVFGWSLLAMSAALNAQTFAGAIERTGRSALQKP